MEIIKKNKKIFLVLIFLGLFIVPFGALASATTGLELDWPKSPSDIELHSDIGLPGAIQYFYEWGIFLGGIAVFIMLVFSGFQYVSSVGDTAKMTEAKNRITSAFLGLILLLSSYLVLNIINPELTQLKEISDLETIVTKSLPSFYKPYTTIWHGNQAVFYFGEVKNGDNIAIHPDWDCETIVSMKDAAGRATWNKYIGIEAYALRPDPTAPPGTMPKMRCGYWNDTTWYEARCSYLTACISPEAIASSTMAIKFGPDPPNTVPNGSGDTWAGKGEFEANPPNIVPSDFAAKSKHCISIATIDIAKGGAGNDKYNYPVASLSESSLSFLSCHFYNDDTKITTTNESYASGIAGSANREIACSYLTICRDHPDDPADDDRYGLGYGALGYLQQINANEGTECAHFVSHRERGEDEEGNVASVGITKYRGYAGYYGYLDTYVDGPAGICHDYDNRIKYEGRCSYVTMCNTPH